MRKNIIMFCVGMISCLLVAAQKNIPVNLSGFWENIENRNASAGLEFINMDSVFLFYDNEKKIARQVNIDDTKNPYWFDFTIDDGSEKFTVRSLLEFVNRDLIKWQVFTSEVRTAHFTQTAGEIMYLRRKKP